MKRTRIFIPSQETIAETNSNINCANYPKYVTFNFMGSFLTYFAKFKYHIKMYMIFKFYRINITVANILFVKSLEE